MMPAFSAQFASRLAAFAAGLVGVVLIWGLMCRQPSPPIRSWKTTGADRVATVALFATADWLACGDEAGSVAVHDAKTGARVSHWNSASSPVAALSLSGDDRTLAVAHRDGTVTSWDLATGRLLLQQSQESIRALQLSADGRLLALGSETGELRLVDNHGAVTEFDRRPPGESIGSLLFSADSRFLAVAVGRCVEVWKVDDRVRLMRSAELEFPAIALGMSADGSELVALQQDAGLTRWRIPQGRVMSTTPGSFWFLDPGAFCPGSQTAAVVGLRGGLRLLDVEDGTELQVIQERGPSIVALSYSADGRWLSVADATNQIQLWNLADANGGDANAWRTSLKTFRRSSSTVIVAGFGLCLVLTVLAAVWDWPAALAVCLVLETVRDPVRKLVSGHPQFLSLSVSGVWLIVALMAVYRSRSALVTLDRRYPELKQAGCLMVLALIPGAVISLSQLPQGGLLAAVGACSYVVLPAFGIALGSACVRIPGTVFRSLAVFVGMSTLGAVTAILEAALWNVPGLGGLDLVWYRSFPGLQGAGRTVLPLFSGIYRSPDVLGLHAALGLMLAAVLFAGARPSRRWFGRWTAVLLTMGFLAGGLLLSGRRKMLALPIMFGIGWLITQRRDQMLRRINGPALMIVTVGVAIATVMVGYGPSRDYLQTLVVDAWPRASQSLWAACETYRQFGFWGAGLGTATQGVPHLVKLDLAIWQEDGVSRALVELGVSGFVLALAAVGFLFRAALKAWRMQPASPLVRGMLLVVLANGAVFFVSHQVYSGDAPLLLLTAMWLGIALAAAEATPRQ